MDSVVIYSPSNSSRLAFVAEWLFRERLHIGYTITQSEEEARKAAFAISYGRHLPGAITIPNAGLLREKGIQKAEPPTGTWNKVPTLYAAAASDHTLPFDLFSAIFFLLSRYEEYQPYTPDKHGRYPATASILYKKGWLQRPIVDEWVYALRKVLQDAGMPMPDAHFLYQPTYDIDMAYSHLHKGMKRIVGAYIRALLKVDVKQISERTQVLKNKQKDPYDSFRWLRQLHKEYGCKPLYFVLSAFKTTAYDKNIHPQHPAMVRVIKNLVRDGAIGIHPSYYSAEGGVLDQEKKMLELVSGRSMYISRQHYIRMKVPDTYRLLLRSGIAEDHTMGYGSHLGFRAGTGSPFLWYDIENETTTALRIHPFCFMDTTAHYEARLSVAASFEKLQAMSSILERTGSVLVTIFHNFSLGTANEWKGWRQAYEHFLQEKAEM